MAFIVNLSDLMLFSAAIEQVASGTANLAVCPTAAAFGELTL